LGADVSHASAEDAGEILRSRVIHFMKLMRMPNGLREVGYTEDDIPALVSGTMPQHRVTKLSPRAADESDLTSLFQQSMSIW
jgi:hydroxyacid-oxoacid transhydrogenase